MVRKRYFDHVSRTGRDVVDRLTHTGYLGSARSWIVGENLAWGSGSLSSPREIVQSWMHSPGHRANILSRRFREIGIGVVFARSEPSLGRRDVHHHVRRQELARRTYPAGDAPVHRRPDPTAGAAVTHPGGPLLVLGAAGTGKTRMLERRFAWLVEQGAEASRVVAIALSPSAAAAMRERLETLVRAALRRAARGHVPVLLRAPAPGGGAARRAWTPASCP